MPRISVGLLSCLLALLISGRVSAAEPVTLKFDQPVVAGMGGLRAFWDMPVMVAADGVTEVQDMVEKDKHQTAVWDPAKRDGGAKPGPLVFDALQRSLLVRFPGTAEVLAARLNEGFEIEKAELVLPYRDHELWPPGTPDNVEPTGYQQRRNWDVDKMYRAVLPRWHAVAYALRQPWDARAEHGPTFNAYIHGAGYWKKYGAADVDHDRHAAQFGPAEVSSASPEGRVDVTAALIEPAYGDTLAARLRGVADRGFLVQKLETYDHHFFSGAYEWGTATGGRGILINTPSLVVTLRPAKNPVKIGDLPAAADVASLAEELKGGKGGAPTAVMPTREQLNALIERFAFRKPEGMPDWQWDHIRQLAEVASESRADDPFFYQFVPHYMRQRKSVLNPETNQREIDPLVIFGVWVDQLVGRQPRGWSGFEAANEMTTWYVYHDSLPGPAQDAIKTYWIGWLMPDRETCAPEQRHDFNDVSGKLIHPMADDPRVGGPDAKNPDPAGGRLDTYVAKTGDWRGNKSFYRSGFCYDMSTQNFNTTSSSGAMLAGAIIGSDLAIADGRHGVEAWPLRQWAWSSGHTQEHIDHYYYAVTLSGQKTVADFGPTFFDRLMGRSMLDKSLEELAGAYHPGLRRIFGGSSRTSLEYLFVKQDGLQYILHTLSPKGSLHDLDWKDSKVEGEMAIWGTEVPMGRVARQSLTGPWADAWVSHALDDKPLPFLADSINEGRWQRTYLAENYAVTSHDVSQKRVHYMAQYRREAKPVERYTDLVTMQFRYGINNTRFANEAGGWIAPIGIEAFVQDKGRTLALGSVAAGSDFVKNRVNAEGLHSMQASLAFFNFQRPATWEIYVDDHRVTSLPFTAGANQRITIKDGVSYIGVIPLPATDLGRQDEVVLREGVDEDWNKIITRPTLVIESVNFQSKVNAADTIDWAKADRAVAGFVIEVGDEKEHGDFTAFQKKIRAAKLDVSGDASAEDPVIEVVYVVGEERIEAGFRPLVHLGQGPDKAFTRRTISGAPAGLRAGIDRDTSMSQQSRTGRCEKAGAVLLTDEGRVSLLQHEPVTGTFVAWNPLPDVTSFDLQLPGGVGLKADGRVGLMRATVVPLAASVRIDHGFRPGETAQGLASELHLTGFAAAPSVTFNGVLVKDVAKREVEGQVVYVVPLSRGD